VQDLEDEIGVDLLRRSPRGVSDHRQDIVSLEFNPFAMQAKW
jgi:hypothetical protein